MIQIIQGTFGYYNGRKVIPITEADGPQKFDDELEARLVKEGVAKYIGELGETAEQPAPAPGAGHTAYGAVSQVEQSAGEFHTYTGRRVPKYVSSAEGNSRTLTISRRPLMIPNNKNPFIVADVLTD